MRPAELGDVSKSGSLMTMFLSGPLMAFCVAAGNTDPSVQQLVDLQVGGSAVVAGGSGKGGGGGTGGVWIGPVLGNGYLLRGCLLEGTRCGISCVCFRTGCVCLGVEGVRERFRCQCIVEGALVCVFLTACVCARMCPEADITITAVFQVALP